MKRLFASVFAAAAIATPALAQDKVKSWRSLDSVGCMMLRECTEGVRQLKSWEDLGPEYEIAATELNQIIQAMDKVGAAVYIADEKYFPLRMRGVYDVRGNNIFLNEFYIDQPTKIIQVIRHEGWHAAQDCMAGTIDNNFIAIIKPEKDVPKIWQAIAKDTYKSQPHAIPWEKEAYWAGHTEGMTAKALESCAAGTMWTDYDPTPMTREWLEENGYIK